MILKMTVIDQTESYTAKASNSFNNQQVNDWSNYDNDNFYGEVEAPGLKRLAVQSGLETGCDVKTLMPHLKTAASILDVGSGYGRVISALRKNGFTGNITSIERNAALYRYVKEQYQNQACVLQMDIHDCNKITDRFDAILFLWSGLADFPANEQADIISMLAQLLNPNGILVIDTMPMDVQPLQTEQFAQQSFLTRAKNSVVQTYEPTYIEIQRYAENANLKNSDILHCKTDTNRTRWLYLLEPNS